MSLNNAVADLSCNKYKMYKMYCIKRFCRTLVIENSNYRTYLFMNASRPWRLSSMKSSSNIPVTKSSWIILHGILKCNDCGLIKPT